jgi:hypothetical protein
LGKKLGKSTHFSTLEAGIGPVLNYLPASFVVLLPPRISLFGIFRECEARHWGTNRPCQASPPSPQAALRASEPRVLASASSSLPCPANDVGLASDFGSGSSPDVARGALWFDSASNPMLGLWLGLFMKRAALRKGGVLTPPQAASRPTSPFRAAIGLFYQSARGAE